MSCLSNVLNLPLKKKLNDTVFLHQLMIHLYWKKKILRYSILSLVARGTKHWEETKVLMHTKRYYQRGTLLLPWAVIVWKKSISSPTTTKMWQEGKEI